MRLLLVATDTLTAPRPLSTVDLPIRSTTLVDLGEACDATCPYCNGPETD